MKAAVLDAPGVGPDGFRIDPDFPDPVPGPDEVLVRVAACALNYLDLWVRRGLDRARPFPHVCGSDVAGTVAGTDRRVMVHPGISCGSCDQCRSGRDSRCARLRVLGVETQGGYAELVAVPEANLFDVPEGWSDEEAAAFPLTFVTAWRGLAEAVSSGTDVLVWGATGGLGVAALQVARALGGRVAVATTSPGKADRLRALGPDLVCVGSPDQIADQVEREIGGVDVAVDPLGGRDVWEATRRVLRPRGRIVSAGDTAGSVVELDLPWLFLGERQVAGVYLGGLADFGDVLAVARRGALRPVVGAVMPLEEAGRAHRMVEGREHVGKVVLRVG